MQKYDLTARASLDTEKATEWITALIENDGQDTDGEFIGVGEDWCAYYEENDVDRLVYVAQRNGVMTMPEGTELFLDYSGNEDGGYYGWLLDFGYDLRIAQSVSDFYKIGESQARGVEAAISVLDEAVSYANIMLDKVAAFITAQNGMEG